MGIPKDDDPEIWTRVLGLAEKGRYSASPNPRVGCVVVDGHGLVVGEGFHERAGGPHAEIRALKAAGPAARGGTLFVNLEPCAHHGRTPPCADAVIAAGVSRVVCSVEDPDPRTAGAGISRLSEAGVQVLVGPYRAEAARLNEAFLVSAREKRPHVHLKWAATLDGKIATKTGASKWITGDAAREAAMRLREESDAILVGAGTVMADDPALTRRLGLNRSIVPHRRLVLDGEARVSPGARVFDRNEGTEAWLITSRGEDDPRLKAFRDRGVRVMSLPATSGRVDLGALMTALFAAETRSLLVEGGGRTAGAFLEAGLVDRVTAFVAPKLFGAGTPALITGGVESPGDAVTLADLEVDRVGPDVWLSGRIARRG